MARFRKHPHLAPLLLWTAVCFLFFSTIILAASHLAESDLLIQFHTFGRFQAREMLAGRLPLWSSGSYAGFPFAADTQAAVFYPLRWITILLSASRDFPYYALEMEGLFHSWLLGLFTYGLAYNITRSRAAGMFAAIAFSLGGYITSYPLMQLAILETIIWLPLILLLLRRGVQSRHPVRWITAAGLVLGFSFLAGHPQSFLHISYLAAFYYLFLTMRARWERRWIIGLGALIMSIALLIPSAAVLPALQYMQSSTRSDVSYAFVAKGFALLDYLQLIVPGQITLWSPMYVGVPTMIFVVFAWLFRPHADAPAVKAEIAFWTIVAGVTFLLSLGDKGILFELVYRVAPGFSFFRQQERIVSLFSLSFALLGAIGFASFQQIDDDLWQRLKRPLLQITLCTIFFIGFLFLSMQKRAWLLIWIQTGVIAGVTFFALREKSIPVWRNLRILILLIFDLSLLAGRQFAVQEGSPAIYWPQPAWISTILEDTHGRIDTVGYMKANVGELYAVEDIRGISPLQPSAMAQFNTLPFERRWQLLNVTHVIAEEPFVDGMTPIEPITESIFPTRPFTGTLYRYDNALPRAWMVYDPVTAESAEAAWQTVASPAFDPAAQVVLTMADGDSTAVTPPASPPVVDTHRLTAGRVQIQTSSSTAGILVISEWNYPGWQATVDGERWTIETADYALQALILPAGDHTIELTYNPIVVKIGITLSLLTLIAALLLMRRWQPLISSRPFKKREGRVVEIRSTAQFRIANKQLWLLGMGLMLLLAFGLRVHHLGTQELRGDEAFSYLFARQPAAEIIPALIQEGDPHTPFHYLLLHGWMGLSGDTEFAMRYLSLLPSFLLVSLLFQLGRLMGGRKLGMTAAFWIAISQSQIWLAQDVRNQYMLALFWGMLATFILLGKIEPKNGRIPSRPLFYWSLYALAAALTVYSHYYGVFILLAHGGFLWRAHGRSSSVFKWIAAGLAAALLFLPWAIVNLQPTVAAGQLSDASTPEAARYLTEIGIELMMGSDVAGWWPRWLMVITAVIILFGIRKLFQNKPEWGVLLAGWAGGSILFIYLIRFSRATFNAFYISIAAPVVWLLFSNALIALWQQRWRGWRIIAIFAAAALLLANMIGLRNYEVNPEYSRSSGYRDVAAAIMADAQEGDLFLAQFPDPVWGYYLRNSDIPQLMHPSSPAAAAEETGRALREIADKYERIWFVPNAAANWDSDDFVGQWLRYNLLTESKTAHKRMQLFAFRPLRGMDQIALPINELLNEQIALQSVYMTINGQPADPTERLSLAYGDTLSVSLLWQAAEPIGEHYTVFVHILAEDGRLIGQHDGIPLFGTRSTRTWEAGERIIDQHDIEITAEGGVQNGRLFIGMYDTDTVERIPFANGETALQITGR